MRGEQLVEDLQCCSCHMPLDEEEEIEEEHRKGDKEGDIRNF